MFGKSKTPNEYEVKFLRTKSSLLEKENNELKSRINALELQLEIYKNQEEKDLTIENMTKAIADAVEAKKTYEELNKQLKERIVEANDLVKSARLNIEKKKVEFERELSKSLKK